MRHPPTLRSVVALALLSALAAFTAPAAAQTTWYVDAAATQVADGSAGKPFRTIQKGVDHAAAGDIVSVAPGDYHENVVIPNLGIRIESQGGPLVTTLRALHPGPAVHSDYILKPQPPWATFHGFTVTDSTVGISDDDYLRVERCIVTGNDVGSLAKGPHFVHSTIVGNGVGIQEKGLGALAVECIVFGNTNWDYLNPTITSVGSFVDCVGLVTVSDLVGAGYSNVLHADPQLWGPTGQEFHLTRTSPCIDYVGADDVGALEFDPTFGNDVQDVGGGLAGAAGVPTLTLDGFLFPGETLVVQVGGGLPGGSAVFVVGGAGLFAPFLGGTLVPSPDVVSPPVPLDALGALTTLAVWPPSVPSGTTVFTQAWLPDPAGPQGFAATNGLKLTAP